MIAPLQAGKTGDALPAAETVFRLLKASKDGRALETHFALTSQDRENPLKSISAWSEKLTTPLQACEFLGENKQTYELYCRLNVDQIRALTVPELPQPPLNAVWDTLFQAGTQAPDPRPGALGHAGITGLDRPPAMERKIYKTLRTKLADLANNNLHLLADAE